MSLKHPNTISFGILLFILLFALSVAYFLYEEQPEGTVFPVPDSGFVFPYSLSLPHRQLYLPLELREVSGLAWAGHNRILAVQDEAGIVYTYDLEAETVVQRATFGKNLDYEGIATDGRRVYVLERDGDIFEIDSLQGPAVGSRKYETPLSYRQDAEGLAYDSFDPGLLVALKEAVAEEKETGEGAKRLIYSFDLRDHRLSEQPRYFIDQLELGRLIYGKERSYEMKPSGLAVHPKNGYIYVIASVGRLLIVMDRGGQLLYAERLDPNLLPQPEGIAFDPQGRLLLASEGRGGQGRLLVFNTRE